MPISFNPFLGFRICFKGGDVTDLSRSILHRDKGRKTVVNEALWFFALVTIS